MKRQGLIRLFTALGMKRRHAVGLVGGLVSACLVVEAARPLCPLLEVLSPRAGEVCRAVTLTATGARRASEGDAP